MSKQIKQNCQKIMMKIENKLGQLERFIKVKKTSPILDKIVLYIMSDFKFLSDDLKIIFNHLSSLRFQMYQKDILIGKYQKQLLSLKSEKKMTEQMMKSKYQKAIKQFKFLQFTGKGRQSQRNCHQRCKSDLIKKGLDELETEIIESQNKVCDKVKQLRSQIQNEKQGYQSLQNKINQKLAFNTFNLSDISLKSQNSPFKQLSLKQPSFFNQNTIKNVYKNIQIEVVPKYLEQTKKKKFQYQVNQIISPISLSKEIVDKSEQFQLKISMNEAPVRYQKMGQCLQSQSTVKINKKKRQELADLIAKQTKVVVSKDKYFNTDI